MNGTQKAKRVAAISTDAKSTIERTIPSLRAINETSARHPRRHLFRAWSEIAARINSAERCALLLDFDGTLVRIRRRPWEVRVPQRTKRLLDRLARNPKLFVAIVSGRRRLDLQTRIGVPTLHFVGLHGAETDGGEINLGRQSTQALAAAKRNAIQRMGSMPGMRIEDKGLSFAVHYREATTGIACAAEACLQELLRPLRPWLKVFEGAMVWEVLPVEIPGKGAAVLDLLNKLPQKTPAIYIGDDGTDESAFRALHDQISVRVGFSPESNAKYYVRETSEVLAFLVRLEKNFS